MMSIYTSFLLQSVDAPCSTPQNSHMRKKILVLPGEELVNVNLKQVAPEEDARAKTPKTTQKIVFGIISIERQTDITVYLPRKNYTKRQKKLIADCQCQYATFHCFLLYSGAHGWSSWGASTGVYLHPDSGRVRVGGGRARSSLLASYPTVY